MAPPVAQVTGPVLEPGAGRGHQSWRLLSLEPSPGMLSVGGWPCPDAGLAPGGPSFPSRQFLVLSNREPGLSLWFPAWAAEKVGWR